MWTRTALFAFVSALIAACASGGADNAPAGGGGSGGATGGTGGWTVTDAGGGTAGTAGTAGSAGSAGSAGTAGTAGSAGTAGAGGSIADAAPEAGWPTCDSQPPSAVQKSILQIWSDNPTKETEVWVPGAIVTAISNGGCSAQYACQIYLQQDPTYSSFGAGAHHAIKLRVSSAVANYFTGLAVGDQVDVLGWAWRYNLGGSNELVIQVNSILPGCAKKVGSSTPTPITGVQLSDLTVTAYEQTHGPLLVQLAGVSGKPGTATEIFGLWPTGIGIGDAGPEDIVSVSPFFLPGGKLTGFTAGAIVDFQSVTGVFGLFVPFVDGGSAPKYLVVYPRTMSELVQ